MWDEARLQVLTAVEMAPSAERRADLAALSTAWRANEAVGIETGYLPGLGDPPDNQAAVGLNMPDRARVPSTPVIVNGAPDSTTEEVAAARLRVAAAVAPPPPPPRSVDEDPRRGVGGQQRQQLGIPGRRRLEQ